MVKIVEKHNRGVLIEGRNNGMAFAFLQQVKDDEFHTVQPASPCKDYLAEVVFTEKHGMPTRAYGLSYDKKLNIFSDVAHMTVKIMPTKGGGYDYSKSIEGDIQILQENYKEVERLINDYEKMLNLKSLTSITPANDGYFLLKFSSEWCESTHSISLYSLLIRALMVATNKDKDIMTFLKSYEYNGGDKMLIQQCLSKIELILKEKKLPPNSRKYSKAALGKYCQSPHDNGIVSWNSSFDEIQLGE